MKIGEKIKQRRTELAITQAELAESLQVARSTISNWEINRNYPDIETIILLSDKLDVTLDYLLRDEDYAVKQISEDTIIRKKLSFRVKLLTGILIIFLALAGLFLFYNHKNNDVTNPDQITSISLTKDSLIILADLPIYQSLTGYVMSPNPKDKEIIEIDLVSENDFSLSNVESLIIPLGNSGLIEKARQIQVKDVNRKTIKAFDLTK